MKLKRLKVGQRFCLSNRLDPELNKWGTILDVGIGSVRVRFDKYKENNERGELVEKKGYTTNIAPDTEV